MIRPTRAFLSAAAMALLVACATRPGNFSYVAPPQQPQDAEALADAMAEFVAATASRRLEHGDVRSDTP